MKIIFPIILNLFEALLNNDVIIQVDVIRKNVRKNM